MTTYYVVVAHDRLTDNWYVPNHEVNDSISISPEIVIRNAVFWAECNKSTDYTVVWVDM